MKMKKLLAIMLVLGLAGMVPTMALADAGT